MQDAQYLIMLNAIGAACTALLAYSLFQIPKPETISSQLALRSLRLAVLLWAIAFSCGSMQVVAKNISELKTTSILLANIGYTTSYFFICGAVAQRYNGYNLGLRSWQYFIILGVTVTIALTLADKFELRNLIMPQIHIVLLITAIVLMQRSTRTIHQGDIYFKICLIFLLINALVTNMAFVQITQPGISTSLRVLLFILLNGIVLTTSVYALFLNDIVEETKKEGLTDPLSGLFNRRLYSELVTRKEKILNGAVILCDIDNFKRINDNFGHAVGDRVIQNFSEILRNEVRPNDIVIRLGGEEFVVVLIDTTIEQAEIIASRLCKTVANHIVSFENNSLSFTASFGVSYIEHQGLECAVQHADGFLYQAKSLGKNRVVSAQSFINSHTTDLSLQS